MGKWPGAKIPGKWKRKWKMAPGPKSPKNGAQNGKTDPKMGVWTVFGSHLRLLNALNSEDRSEGAFFPCDDSI